MPSGTGNPILKDTKLIIYHTWNLPGLFDSCYSNSFHLSLLQAMFQIKVHVITLKGRILLIKKFCSRPCVCLSLQAIWQKTEKAESHMSSVNRVSLWNYVCLRQKVAAGEYGSLSGSSCLLVSVSLVRKTNEYGMTLSRYQTRCLIVVSDVMLIQ